DVGVLRIDGDLADVLSVIKADVRPGLAGVGGLVHAVAVADRIAQSGLAAADVDGVRRGRRNRQSADRSNRLSIEHRHPDPPGVRGLPAAAVAGAHVDLVGPPGHAADGVHAAAAKRSEHPPLEAGVETRIVRRRRARDETAAGTKQAENYEN